jgi:hypothetical protein
MSRKQWLRWRQRLQKKHLISFVVKHADKMFGMGGFSQSHNHRASVAATLIAKRPRYPNSGLKDNYLLAANLSQVKVSLNATKQRLSDGLSKSGKLKHKIYTIAGGMPTASRYIPAKWFNKLTPNEAADLRTKLAVRDIQLKLHDLKALS